MIPWAAARSELRITGHFKAGHPRVLTGTILCLCFVFPLLSRPFPHSQPLKANPSGNKVSIPQAGDRDSRYNSGVQLGVYHVQMAQVGSWLEHVL